MNIQNQHREMFADILKYALNNGSSSRPPRIELTGILVPCNQIVHGSVCNFKLDVGSKEYLLSMSDSVAAFAKKMEWEEVTVKGFLDPIDGLFEVEKINLAQYSEPFRLTMTPHDSSFELDQYKRTISRRGKLDMAPEYLLS